MMDRCIFSVLGFQDLAQKVKPRRPQFFGTCFLLPNWGVRLGTVHAVFLTHSLKAPTTSVGVKLYLLSTSIATVRAQGFVWFFGTKHASKMCAVPPGIAVGLGICEGSLPCH